MAYRAGQISLLAVTATVGPFRRPDAGDIPPHGLLAGLGWAK